MAELTVLNITETIAANQQQPIAYGQGGLEVEFFRVSFTGGVATGDTAIINPRWLTDVRSVIINATATDNIDPAVRNSNVTLTLRGTIPTTVSGTFSAQIIGRR